MSTTRAMQSRAAATQELILAHALHLFNEQGAGPVTVRHIARAAGISHGNLCYHFPNTDALIQRLYEQLVERLNTAFSTMLGHSTLSLAYMLQFTRAAMDLLYEYRFLLLDFVAVMRRIEPVRIHYRALQAMRSAQFRQLLDALVQAGLLRPEPLPGQFDALKEQATLFGDYWISSAEIFFEGAEADKKRHYQRLFMALLVPYLTEKGLQAYRELDFS